MSRRRVSLAFMLALLLPGSAAANTTADEKSAPGLEVVFTFDDGPHDVNTPLILAELKKHRVQAVFFWVGKRLRGKTSSERRKIAVQAVAEGHLVGNHTMSHAHLCRGNEADAAREIDDASVLLTEVTGLPAGLFRAPYGDSCARLERMLSERGLVHTGWNIDPMEWKSHSAAQTIRHVIARLSKMQGRAILLLHDNQEVTVKALPVILDWIDRENARRRQAGEPRIRILAGIDLVTGQLPVLSVWNRWFSMSATLARGRWHILRRQLSPFGLGYNDRGD